MKKNVKQVAGIDVAQDELVVRLGRMYDDWSPELYASKTFANTAKGFESLIAWVKKLPMLKRLSGMLWKLPVSIMNHWLITWMKLAAK
jgi:hypothetical protein